MCMHPFKNWELNESLEDLNDFTSGFTQIEVANLEIDNSEEKKAQSTYTRITGSTPKHDAIQKS